SWENFSRNLSSHPNQRNSYDDPNDLTIVKSLKPLQRRFCLKKCGWGFNKRMLDDTLQRMEHAGEYEKAAAWALFHGEKGKAILVLNNSGDQQLKLVSTVIAGVLSYNQDLQSEMHSHWLDMCRNMSRELQNPYVRAMFSYITTSSWKSVLQEDELPLRDRLGIALKFLSDDELTAYLQDTADKFVESGNISGIMLTGLTQDGVDLFANYINKTGDIQTASLALSFCGLSRSNDNRVKEWIESYRTLLDRWEMFHARASFDIARGKTMGRAELLSSKLAPDQVFVTCNYCSQNIAQETYIPRNEDRDSRSLNTASNGISLSRQKINCCKSCRKPLPRCAICLLNLGTPIDSVRDAMESAGLVPASVDRPFGFDLWFTWCQTCRHGGHAIHMLQWFESHEQCP
ncbi:2077_t:CDS:2, partial [Paraglomus occultum]